MGYSTDFQGSLTIEPPMIAEHRDFVNRVAKSDSHPDLPDCPDSYLQWVISEDGASLSWDGSEKFYKYDEWLEYLIENYFTPWGYTLKGEIRWQGEEGDDSGIIYVKGDQVECVEDRRHNPGPSWAPQ